MKLSRLSRPPSLTGARGALLAFAVATGMGATCNAAEQPYPIRPIKIISPFSAGSPPDTLGRLVAQHLSSRLGQSVTVENRPGAGSTIATKAAAASEPDGYTLLQVNAALAYSPTLYPNSGYEPLKSFTPVAGLATWSHLLVVPASVRAGTIQELIAHAKVNPGRVNIGFPLGSPPHILTETLTTTSGAKFNNIPYRQVSQLTSDLLDGRIDAFFGAGAGLVSLIQQGKLRALAYTGITRYPALPHVPTVTEVGFPQLAFDPSDWTGIVAPAGTPSEAINKINAAVNQILAASETQAALTSLGWDAKIVSSQEFATFLAGEAKKWPVLVKASGLEPN
jgi:tripartite-type tricarboxylate transporter receptor subunit TctC